MAKSYRVLALVTAGNENRDLEVDAKELLYGKPLISYAIMAAKGCSFVDRVMVSTDDDELATMAHEWGAEVPYLLPAFVTADGKLVDEVLYAVDYLKRMDDAYDIIVTLPSHYPLRSSGDISGALSLFAKTGCDSLLSVSPLKEHPLKTRTMDEQTGLLLPFLKNHSTARYKDMPFYYHVNGALYINYSGDISSKTSFDENDCGFLMDDISSMKVEDMKDLKYCEFLMGDMI